MKRITLLIIEAVHFISSVSAAYLKGDIVFSIGDLNHDAEYSSLWSSDPYSMVMFKQQWSKGQYQYDAKLRMEADAQMEAGVLFNCQSEKSFDFILFSYTQRELCIAGGYVENRQVTKRPDTKYTSACEQANLQIAVWFTVTIHMYPGKHAVVMLNGVTITDKFITRYDAKGQIGVFLLADAVHRHLKYQQLRLSDPPLGDDQVQQGDDGNDGGGGASPPGSTEPIADGQPVEEPAADLTGLYIGLGVVVAAAVLVGALTASLMATRSKAKGPNRSKKKKKANLDDAAGKKKRRATEGGNARKKKKDKGTK